MDRARPYLKVAAVVSAVTLVGALVAYRAGAFSTPTPVESQPEPQPATAPQTAPEQPATTTDQPNPVIMYGSKSAPAFYPVQPSSPPGAAPATPAPNAGQPPVFLGGSKSSWIYSGPTGLKPIAPPQPTPNAPLP